MHNILKTIEEGEFTKTARYSSHTKGDSKFYGTNSWEEALSIFKYGDPKLADSIRTATESQLEKLHTDTSSYIPDVQGDFFDVAKVVIGEPEAYYRKSYHHDTKPKRTVRVQVNTPSHTSASYMLASAGYLLARIRELEIAGEDVKLIVVSKSSSVTRAGDSHIVEVVAKDYGESFNYLKLSSLMHISFFRRIIFRLRELKYGNKLASGYGRTVPYGDVRLEDRRTIENYFNKGVSND